MSYTALGAKLANVKERCPYPIQLQYWKDRYDEAIGAACGARRANYPDQVEYWRKLAAWNLFVARVYECTAVSCNHLGFAPGANVPVEQSPEHQAWVRAHCPDTSLILSQRLALVDQEMASRCTQIQAPSNVVAPPSKVSIKPMLRVAATGVSRR